MHPPFDLLPPLWRGVGITLQLTILAAVLAVLTSFVIGFARLARYRLLRVLATLYVEIFRGTSVLVQLFWVYYVLPFFNLKLTAMQAGILVLGLNYGAYGSEIVRSSILAIPKHQTEAGIALNMTPNQIMARIILPQALLLMLPPFGNLFIELLKGTALVSLITLSDLMFQGTLMRTSTLRSFEVFSLVLILYFLLAYPITLAVRAWEKKLSQGRA
ncbi:MAG: ectoine/hydroxyectoine ABC transporter permease subunit EhuC [bacterium]|nr:ectoine/hydroxyectoine ABC transporter permease subunit EhuC [Bacillota bacterium]HHW54627.1 ectoine/hydroxyectoine ABC transporter permease subunit EhuC [Bacillota bacterium]